MQQSHDHAIWADAMFRLAAVRRHTADERAWRQSGGYWSLLVLAGADGELEVDGKAFVFLRGGLWLLPPACAIGYRVRGQLKACYELRFEAVRAGGGAPAAAGHPAGYRLLEGTEPIELRGWREQDILPLLEQVAQWLGSDKAWERMQANIRFQELMLHVLRQDESYCHTDVLDRVKRTAFYMEEHLSGSFNREQLAEQAVLHPDYYARVFKRIFGKSPIAYLKELRMREAKQRMVESRESIRSIALDLGFQDEFYFSRQFKHETGAAPTVYVNRIKQAGKVASLNHLVTGHLMALDAEPYAAVINDAFPAVSGLLHTRMIGQTEPELAKLQQSKPDIILIRGSRSLQPVASERLLHQIAPTIVLDYQEDWRTHFRVVAKLIGKEASADRWLDQYQDRAERTRSVLKAKLGDERVLIVGFGARQQICLFGSRNIGTVLYDDLQLAAPEGVREIAHYRQITMDELLRMETEHMIFTPFQHDGTASTDRMIHDQMRNLLESRHWQQRVRRKPVQLHSLFDTRHLYTSYNAMSNRLFLEQVCELLQVH